MIAMVSNMRFLQSSSSAALPPGESSRRRRVRPTRSTRLTRSNLSAAAIRCARATACVVMVVFASNRAAAQPSPPPAPQQQGSALLDSVKFVAGGLAGLAMHEGGHLIFDAAFDAQPHLQRVQFGPFPFFAIAHRGDLSPRREFMISSAGFWVQEATNEWLLVRRPQLRHERAWTLKGMFAFNVLT